MSNFSPDEKVLYLTQKNYSSYYGALASEKGTILLHEGNLIFRGQHYNVPIKNIRGCTRVSGHKQSLANKILVVVWIFVLIFSFSMLTSHPIVLIVATLTILAIGIAFAYLQQFTAIIEVNHNNEQGEAVLSYFIVSDSPFIPLKRNNLEKLQILFESNSIT